MPSPLIVLRTARRVYPILLAAYRRWDSLSPEDKERYRKLARRYAESVRDAVQQTGPGQRRRRRSGRR